MKTRFALPYPVSDHIDVYVDDGNWPERYFMRPMHEIEKLFTCRYKLRTDPDDGDPDLSSEEWEKLSTELVENHPDSLFIYTSNEKD